MYIRKILVAVAIIGAVIGGVFSYHVYTVIFSPNTSFSKEKVSVYIPTGSNYAYVRQQLKPLVENLENFDIVAQKKKYINNVDPGRFILTKGMNNNQMVNSLRSNNVPVSIIFNNQERLENLAGRIAEQIEADSIALLQAMKDTSFLKKNGFDLKNALSMYIPNKYEFYWNTSAVEFRERMLTEYERFWTEERSAKAEKMGLSPQEVMVVASIVQKETSEVSERERIAGVYMNRLQNDWPLEADPTVIFAIKQKTNNFDTIIKRVLYKDLKLDSPYNTYMYAGLPPGPIAMPDISSIDAVLNYEDHDYFFFVASVENFGFHEFAKTLRQHNRNKQEYVQWLEKQDIER